MTKQINKYIGSTGRIKAGSLSVDVTVLDVKNTYGRNRFLVEPVSGQGKQWVENIRVR